MSGTGTRIPLYLRVLADTEAAAKSPVCASWKKIRIVGVLVGYHGRFSWPPDSERGVVPTNPSLTGWLIRLGYLVKYLSAVRKSEEPVRKAFGNIQHASICRA